ncbi:MAG: hypothetical protein U0165_04855 [Polyangiaceae bacterium]
MGSIIVGTDVAANQNMNHPLVRWVALLSWVTAAVGCAGENSDELEGNDDTGSPAVSTQALTATTGPRITLGGTITVPIAGIRSSQTQSDLTSLIEGSTAPLQLVVPPSAGLAQLVEYSGATTALSLGSKVYDVGAWSPNLVRFPEVRGQSDSASKTNAFITVAFKPTEIKYLKASGDIAKPAAAPSSSASVTAFHLALGSSQSTPAMSIAAATLDPALSTLELTVKMNAEDLNTWGPWASTDRRNGTLTYVGPAGSITVELTGVTATPPKPTDSPQLYECKYYCEHAKLEVKKSTP